MSTFMVQGDPQHLPQRLFYIQAIVQRKLEEAHYYYPAQGALPLIATAYRNGCEIEDLESIARSVDFRTWSDFRDGVYELMKHATERPKRKADPAFSTVCIDHVVSVKHPNGTTNCARYETTVDFRHLPAVGDYLAFGDIADDAYFLSRVERRFFSIPGNVRLSLVREEYDNAEAARDHLADLNGVGFQLARDEEDPTAVTDAPAAD